MATRSIGTGAISFGLVLIPFKLYTSASAKSVHFNMLHKGCSGRVSQRLLCAKEEIPIAKSDTVRGFEVAKDRFVVFSDEEIAELEAERTGALKIEEFVPLDAIDPLLVQKTYFVGPDKGGDRPYHLLSLMLEEHGVIGVGRFKARGKDELVFVRPYKGGIVLHESYYANETRSFSEVEIGERPHFSDLERRLAGRIVQEMRRPNFDPSRYKDRWAEKVLAAAQRKAAGEAYVSDTEPAPAAVADLMEALKRSVSSDEERQQVQHQEQAAEHAGPGPRKAQPTRITSDGAVDEAPETVAEVSAVIPKGGGTKRGTGRRRRAHG